MIGRDVANRVFLSVIMTIASSVYAVDFEGIIYKDNPYTLEDFDGQSVIITYMNTHRSNCSSTVTGTSSAIKKLHTRRIQEKLPIQIIVAERSNIDYMMAQIGLKHDPVKGIIYARIRNSSSFNDQFHGSVLIKPDGSRSAISLPELTNEYANMHGSFPVKGDDFRKSEVRDLWWRFVNGDYSIFKKIMALAKKKDEEAAILLSRIEHTYGQRIRSLLYDIQKKESLDQSDSKKIKQTEDIEAPLLDMFGNFIEKNSELTMEIVAIEKTNVAFRSLETLKEYDSLAAYIKRVEKSKTLKNLIKIAKKRLKYASKSSILQDEIQARAIFRKATGPCNGGCRDVWNQYTKGFKTIVLKYPETEYGMLAQTEYDRLDAIGFQGFANNFRSGRF